MGLQLEDNKALRCVQCNRTLKRNKKLNITFCPSCGLTRFHLELPQHIIISTVKETKE